MRSLPTIPRLDRLREIDAGRSARRQRTPADRRRNVYTATRRCNLAGPESIAKPDLLFFLPTVISDAKLLLENMNEFGLGQGRFDHLVRHRHRRTRHAATVSPELLQGLLTCVASWGAKGHEALIAELKTRFKEPWMTQNAISTYGDMWIIKDALEKAGKADRVTVGDPLRSIDAGPSKYYPLGEIKFDEKAAVSAPA